MWFICPILYENTKSDKETVLKGTEGKRIVCLANLREQKIICFGRG
jgi:hypothetical protein